MHSSDYLDICRQAERYDDYLDREPEEDAFLDDRIESILLDREEQE
jgi:hypothetical protein